ncbi:MAG: efflux RND transporter periplasmic adaptor subunit [Pseudomonadota bacterium]
MRRRWILVALLAGAFSHSATAEQWQQVTAADRPITVTASGVVAPRNGLVFGPPPSRNWNISITKLAREGTRVEKGDVLAEFDGSESDDRINTKEGELNTKRSERESLLETQSREIEEDKLRIAEARSDAEKAERKASVDERVYAGLEYRKLIEEREIAKITYAREQERAVLVARVRQSKMNELEADIRRLESELAAAKSELASFTIKAPRDGLVIVGSNQQGQKLDVNDSVNPGLTVIELIDDSDLIVTADIPEFAAARISVGQSATVSLDATGGNALPGRVIAVASIVRRQSRFSEAMVRSVTIDLDDNSLDILKPGLSSKVTLTVATERNALAVPEQALSYRNGQPGVVVRGAGWQAVTLGSNSDGQRVVTEGLQEGMEIAL